MHGVKARFTVGFAALGLAIVVGCGQSLFTIASNFQLQNGLESFDVQAGQPVQKHGSIGIQSTGTVPSIKSGKLLISPSKITFTPTSGTPKGNVNAQAAENTITVTVKLDTAEADATVCDSGEEYGPFVVTLDSNNQPTSVDPSEVTLSQNVIDLLNGGRFSVCIDVTSTVNGTVGIQALTFKFGV
ncbi:MAG: hypothetical protein HY287_02085 [Planctomycetes bacterium]|nr:hypothetical protein [Planctomycetota bacterium]MBI3833100.1 hypothetical protein [Planctomycetota bacterium]